MLFKTFSAAVFGIDAYLVEAEVDVAPAFEGRYTVVGFNVSGRSIQSVTDAARAAVARLGLPASVEVSFGGEGEAARAATRSLFGIAAITMLLLSVWSNIPATAMSILFACFAGVLSAASNLVYVYLPELFPTDLRASGIGLAVAASRIGSAVSTFLLPVVVAAYGVRSALGACVVVLVVGAVVCHRWAPETKHVRLGVFDQVGAS